MHYIGFENKTIFEQVEKDSDEWRKVEESMQEKTWIVYNDCRHWDNEWNGVKFKLIELERIQNKHFF